MKREDIENLKNQVGCAAVLETAGFALDAKESTPRAGKFRRGSDIIIVTHEGRGWFDPLSDDKGDVFSLVSHLDHVGFAEGLERVAALIGFQPSAPVWSRATGERTPGASVAERWEQRRRPWRGSATWEYLCGERCLLPRVVLSAIDQGTLREGPYGSMWAAHTDADGAITGWEERGAEWRGFATGGAKILFRFGAAGSSRICVTEAAIDAMSLAAVEGIREGTLYLSTGGGWSPNTEAALKLLITLPGAELVAATDANSQGDAYAGRLRALANEVGCTWQRLRPPAGDWNEALQQREKKNRERQGGKRGVPHARRPGQGKLRPAEPALDPVGRDVGGAVGVMKD